MKRSLCWFLNAVLFVSFVPLAAAQSSTNCDDLRLKIKKIEQMNFNDASPSLQQIYREALFKLYAQCKKCIEQELVLANELKTNVVGTEGAQVVDQKVASLNKEKAEIEAKLVAAQTVLNTPGAIATDGSSSPGVSEPPPSNGSVGNGSGGNAASSRPTAEASAQATPSCTPGAEYPNAPPLLTNIVDLDAKDIASGDQDDIASLAKMVLYTTLDAASPTSSELLRELEPYQFLSETARTDKQLGASSNSDGAVSAIEKPGFARLLGFAVEHGAINKINDGTNLTLSTSLYSLYLLKNEDTAETYSRAGFLNRIGASASFDVTNNDNDLTNATRNNLKEWSAKIRLFGDRSTRSAKFQRFWKQQIEPLIDTRLRALGEPLEALSTQDPDFTAMRRKVDPCLRQSVQRRLQDPDYKAATEEQRVKILSDLMIGLLKTNVFDRVKAGDVKLSDKMITDIETKYVPNLKSALDNLKSAGGLIEKKLDDLRSGPLATFAYTNHRVPTGSDYSETKFLFEQDKSFFRPLKLIGNVGFSFYNKPNPLLNQERLRDFTAALAFEGSSSSPFTESENQSKITYSFVGRYERLFENDGTVLRKPDIGTFQFVMEIPFFKGLSLPLSATYANGTEEEHKKHFRFNFGMRLDTDKLFELLKARTP